MPIRRAAAAAPPKEEAPEANAPEEDAATEDSAPVEKEKDKEPVPASNEEGGDGDDQAKKDGETADEGEKSEEAGTEQGKSKKKKVKDVAKIEKDGDDKGKKAKKKKIPVWAAISSKRFAATSLSQPKVEEIIIEAIESCKERGGVSAVTMIKYVKKKYPSVEMDKKTKNQYKKALKRMVEKGAVKQLKGKGFSGSFAIGKKSAVTAGTKETLGDALPLIITRLCEPKEASYILIKKYLEQHFPQLNVENRPDVLKNCLQRSVEKGYLEQITGKGASGTFQLKKAGKEVLMGGGLLEDAIVAAITAMNEPKTCSITTLRKFLMEEQKERNVYLIVNNMKRTLQKCKMMGWMEQISGHGLSGSYQLSYPYYPSPAVLFPEMMEKLRQKEEQKLRRKKNSDESSDEESEEEAEEESEEEESDDEPPRKKRNQRSAPRARQNEKATSNSRKSTVAKRSIAPAKKPARSAKKPARSAKKPAQSAKKPAVAAKKAPEPKATPVKKAAPTSKPKTPIAKKMTSRGIKRPAPKAAKKEESAVKSKPGARTSLRARK
ncbi:heterochromatin protein 1-binding protein 3 [Myxocyprinus asiaticus]|uniref:heterochromatin protein 1-binding protein 3 n=1 Tax=Myxocyprinus asiaticus TaxID=70543 RepID=UPI00222266A2|nr:heterochromatin protein 1-binding protein 3 [Myxocyprinus asiaticus]